MSIPDLRRVARTLKINITGKDDQFALINEIKQHFERRP
jgi:hypothetical protein